MVEKANSGHPGLPMGSAAMAYALWTQLPQIQPEGPALARPRSLRAVRRARIAPSSTALLHLTGFDSPSEELKRFRQWGSRTPGHPEYGRTPGVEATTGPLGQGFGNAVGMAIAEDQPWRPASTGRATASLTTTHTSWPVTGT